MSIAPLTFEHSLDVLRQYQNWCREGDAALAIITETVGGAVRGVGALMAVKTGGQMAGYVSGGCIDADVAAQACAALKDGRARRVRYGAGSPFVDLPLPCGGAIEVLILPDPHNVAVDTVLSALNARRPVAVTINETGMRLSRARAGSGAIQCTYRPKAKIRIAGRGADCIALTHVALASGFEVALQLTDDDDYVAAVGAGLQAEKLQSPRALPPLQDDADTAFVLMLHDGDWEEALLAQALSGPALYIGAVGSVRTHAKRCDRLRLAGFDERAISRIHGPIGLVPALRDASTLAISTLAEIINVFAHTEDRAASRTALILLAAGAASRFEDGDKLLAPYGTKRVLEAVADLKTAAPFARAIAVTACGQTERQNILREAGWAVLENPAAETGQASSLSVAIGHIEKDMDIDNVLILLGDMPAVSQTHLRQVLRAAARQPEAIMSQSHAALSPPALFHRSQFGALKRVEGDRGARRVFETLPDTMTVPLDDVAAIDVDTRADLQRLEAVAHG